MSYKVIKRLKNTPSLFDKLTLDEKENIPEWCPITDELLREAIRTGAIKGTNDIDEAAEQISNNDFTVLINKALDIRKQRKKKNGQLVEETEEERQESKRAEEEREKLREKQEYLEYK